MVVWTWRCSSSHEESEKAVDGDEEGDEEEESAATDLPIGIPRNSLNA